jgi:GAF domain-containing protein
VLPYNTWRGTPIEHRGARVGYLFVVEKEGGGELTAGDEEMLPLFASPGGTATTAARAFQDEPQPRNRLEPLARISHTVAE